MGNRPTICRDYNKGICRCESCKSHERELSIHRSSDDFINRGSLVKFRNSTEWFVNNNEEKCEVRYTSSVGVTQGFQVGINYPWMQMAFNYHWSRSDENSYSYQIPVGSKGRVWKNYERINARLKYVKLFVSDRSDHDNIGHEQWYDVAEDDIQFERLVSNQVEIVKLIQYHINGGLGIHRQMDYGNHIFKYCMIKVQHSSKFINVFENSNNIGTPLVQWDESTHMSEKFTFVLIDQSPSKGYFACQNCEHRSIGVQGNIENNVPLKLVELNPNSENQQFKLVLHSIDSDGRTWCSIRLLSDPKFMWTIVDNSMRNGWILTLKNNDNDDVNMNQRFYLDNS